MEKIKVVVVVVVVVKEDMTLIRKEKVNHGH